MVALVDNLVWDWMRGARRATLLIPFNLRFVSSITVYGILSPRLPVRVSGWGNASYWFHSFLNWQYQSVAGLIPFKPSCATLQGLDPSSGCCRARMGQNRLRLNPNKVELIFLHSRNHHAMCLLWFELLNGVVFPQKKENYHISVLLVLLALWDFQMEVLARRALANQLQLHHLKQEVLVTVRYHCHRNSFDMEDYSETIISG